MKRFWNRVQKAFDIHNATPNLSSEAKDGERLKRWFITYFDGGYGISFIDGLTFRKNEDVL